MINVVRFIVCLEAKHCNYRIYKIYKNKFIYDVCDHK